MLLVQQWRIFQYKGIQAGNPLAKYNGQYVWVQRHLRDDEYDMDEVGPMYRVKFADGKIADAFEDELEPVKVPVEEKR